MSRHYRIDAISLTRGQVLKFSCFGPALLFNICVLMLTLCDVLPSYAAAAQRKLAETQDRTGDLMKILNFLQYSSEVGWCSGM